MEAEQAGTQVAKADNLPRVNLALKNQEKKLNTLLHSIKNEYSMQTAANLSKMNWSLQDCRFSALFLCYFSEVPLAFRCSESNKPVIKELLLSFSQIVIAK